MDLWTESNRPTLLPKTIAYYPAEVRPNNSKDMLQFGQTRQVTTVPSFLMCSSKGHRNGLNTSHDWDMCME